MRSKTGQGKVRTKTATWSAASLRVLLVSSQSTTWSASARRSSSCCLSQSACGPCLMVCDIENASGIACGSQVHAAANRKKNWPDSAGTLRQTLPCFSVRNAAKPRVQSLVDNYECWRGHQLGLTRAPFLGHKARLRHTAMRQQLLVRQRWMKPAMWRYWVRPQRAKCALGALNGGFVTSGNGRGGSA